ncbi:LCP family protein [Streptomyces sp. NBC_01142]|uniref:LCP family protein n=1 Tax=Streptomyces sp. NBC_01142 TaxID=2975865 RepID=UPI00224EC25C|nr:LCP family protein [Streptomyces sp. NBC_01142]MCX4825332.1 LCP family protein [Streptomyces sp. NBC_01142]
MRGFSRSRFAVTAVLLASLASAGTIATADGLRGSSPYADKGKGKGTNVLVVGIDRRDGISAKDRNRLHVGGKGCNCTDVMMVVHLAEDGKRMSVVSIPRDSYVEFADHAHPRHSGKINGAFAHGGGDLAVRTVEKATGLRIDHYLETDFVGFASTVDRLGGATVCTDTPLSDLGSGLKLAAGTHRVDGNNALRYVRARHVSPPGDLGRVRRQQRVLIGMMSRLRAEGALADPAAAFLTAHRLLTSVRTDARTSVVDLMRLGAVLSRLEADRTEFVTVPMSDFDHRVPEWGSTLLWDKERSAALWAALREDRTVIGDPDIRPSMKVPVEFPPAALPLRVTDAEVARALRANGFVVEDAAGRPGTPRPKGPTVITYDPYWARYAPTVAAALPGAQLRPVIGHGQVFTVTVGSEGATVVEIVHDRSSVEGAPAPGGTLLCAEPGLAG